MRKFSRLNQLYLHALCVLVLISICTGCAASNAVCTISEAPYYEKEYLPDQTLQSIQIGHNEYSVQYESSRRNSFDKNMYHTYIVDTDDSQGQIVVDASGQWISFSQIHPFDTIPNIEALSEQELQSAVKDIVGEFLDFSIYNTCSVSEAPSGYRLTWQVKREMPCNITLTVSVGPDGSIYSAYITNACPNELSESFISVERRDALISETLSNRALQKGSEFNPSKISVNSEMLSLYEGNHAILYSVSVTNANGYVEVYPIVIMQTENGVTCLY